VVVLYILSFLFDLIFIFILFSLVYLFYIVYFFEGFERSDHVPSINKAVAFGLMELEKKKEKSCDNYTCSYLSFN